MADQNSSGMMGGDCHLYTTIRQHGYLHIYSASLGVVATWRGRGEESGEEGTDDNERWRVSHYDTTYIGVQITKIDGERIVGHDINSIREGFAYCSECPFLAPFSSVFYTSELGRRFKSKNLGNWRFFLEYCLLYLQAVFRVAKKIHYGRRVALH